ncbi:hypothetical protein FRB91_003475, partial [Serendipita sp. 411]
MEPFFTSFRMSRLVNAESSKPGNDSTIRDSLNTLVSSIVHTGGCNVTCREDSSSDAWIFTLSGTHQSVLAAKGIILREAPLQLHRATIKVPRSEILDHASTAPRLKAEVRRQLDEVAAATSAHISVINPQNASTESDSVDSWIRLESERSCELMITGKQDAVDIARVLLLVMLDRLGGLHVEQLDIDVKLLSNFWLLPMNFMPPSLIPAQIIPALELISSTTSCDAIYKNNCFEFHGLEPDVTKAVALMMEQDIVRPFGHEIHFQIEMANEHRDFISGKKNGKINKIMQLSNVVIKFETLNDFNFIISVQGNDSTALPGLGFLKEELPAEISFHVPEVYHKRIIGVGGKSIQKIMKKYGTFVKFSNQEEYNAIGGYHDNDDNVLARTPAKNTANLENLRQAIMELVAPKDKDFMTERIDVPRRYHRALLGESSIFIHDIERKSACKVRFPDRELAEDYVDIFGPDAQVHIAAAMLLVSSFVPLYKLCARVLMLLQEHVPFEAEMTVPPSPELPRVINTPHFADFAEGIKRELHVTVVPQLKNGNERSVFKFRCQRSNADYLSPAKELLESYLLNHNIQIYVTQA